MFIAMAAFSKPQSGLAAPGDLSSAAAKYPNIAGSSLQSCNLCHTSSIPGLNPYGAAYKANGRNSAAFGLIENLDSDGDGFKNLQEINSLTFPGDPASFPTVPTSTKTAIPPTPTKTSPPPTSTPTALPPTLTKTAVPSTPTKTTIPPTATSTTLPPTSTTTTQPPTPTSIIQPSGGTPDTPAPGGLDLDIKKFKVPSRIELQKKGKPIEISLDVKNTSLIDGQGVATVVGVLNNTEIYRVSMPVSDPIGGGSTRFKFPSYTPITSGKIVWTVTLEDGNPDVDTRTRTTKVTKSHEDDDDD